MTTRETEGFNRPAFEKWIREPTSTVGAKDAFYYLISRLINDFYDRHLDETLEICSLYRLAVENLLRKKLDDDETAMLYGMLSSLVVELGQYRHEVAGLKSEEIRKERLAASRTLSRLLESENLAPLKDYIKAEVFPLIEACVERYYPYRVILAGAIAEKLFDISRRTNDAKVKHLLNLIYRLKYPRFGTSGVRGVWGRDITQERVRCVTQAVCDYIKRTGSTDEPLVLGYDSRLHADLLAEWVTGIFLANGFNVAMTARDTPTPVLNFYGTVQMGGKVSGIIACTASHNPPEWHGVKFTLRSGLPAPTSVTDWIGARANLILNMGKILAGDEMGRASESGRLDRFDPLDDYCNWVIGKAKASGIDLENIRTWFQGRLVAVDEMYGSGRGYLGAILERTGVNTVVIHGTRDPEFDGLAYANPEEPFVSDLKHTVKRMGAVVGLAMDADADRFGVVDEDGSFFQANQVIAMLAEHLLVNRGMRGKVIRSFTTDPVINQFIDTSNVSSLVLKPDKDAIPPYAVHPFYVITLGKTEQLGGGSSFVTMVGIKYQAEAMRMNRKYQLEDSSRFRETFIVAGEESGGMTSKGHISDKDGLWTDLLVVDMLAFCKKSLREIWGNMARRIGYMPFSGRVDVDGTDEMKSKLVNFYLYNPDTMVAGLTAEYVGGIPHDFVELHLVEGSKQKSRLIVRASGTEPICRIYTESDSEEKRRKIESEVIRKFEEISSEDVAKSGNMWELVDLLRVTPPFPRVIAVVKEKVIQTFARGGDRSSLLQELSQLVAQLDTRKRANVQMWIPLLEEWGARIPGAVPSLSELRDGIIVFGFDLDAFSRGESWSKALDRIKNLLVAGHRLAVISLGGTDGLVASLVVPLRKSLKSSKSVSSMRALTLYSDGAGRKFAFGGSGKLSEAKDFASELSIPRSDLKTLRRVIKTGLQEVFPPKTKTARPRILMRRNVQMVITPIGSGMRDKLVWELRKLVAGGRLRGKYEVLISGETEVGVVRAGVGKKRALEDLARGLKIPLEKVVYFGDQFYQGGSDASVEGLNVKKVSLNPMEKRWDVPKGVLFKDVSDILELLR